MLTTAINHVLLRQNRLKKLVDLDAPKNIIEQEKKLIQQAMKELAAAIGFPDAIIQLEGNSSLQEIVETKLNKNLEN